MAQNRHKVETDINVAIIDVVRQCPKLYNNQLKVSAAERQQIWLELAERLQLREQFIRIRWHLLRERFQLQNSGERPSHNGSTFKYFSQMAFLRPHLRSAVTPKDNAQANIFKPEFIITEKDLADDGGETGEYVFLEVESLEIMEEEQEAVEQQSQIQQQNGEEIEIVTTNLTQDENKELMDQLTEERAESEEQQKLVESEQPHEDVKPTQVEAKPQEDTKQPQVVSKPHEDTQPPHVVPKRQQQQEQPNEKKIKISSPRTLNSLQTTEEIKLKNTEVNTMEMVPVVAQVAPKQVASPLAEKVAAVKAVSQSPPPSVECKTPTIIQESIPVAHVENNKRCEDDIFGELVSAMLKPIDAERKRAIKKDIMNLLLS